MAFVEITFRKMTFHLRLPLDQRLSIGKCQNDHRILANNSNCVAFLVQAEGIFDRQNILQGERCFCLTLFEANFTVFVNLQVNAVYEAEYPVRELITLATSKPLQCEFG